MNAITDAENAKRIVIALPAESLGALGLTAAPEPGRGFVLTGLARTRDAYPAGQDGPAEVTFELTPQSLVPAEGAMARPGQAAQAPGAAPAPRDPVQEQKNREAFFRSLFQEDD